MRWFGYRGSVPEGHNFGCCHWVPQEKDRLPFQCQQVNESLDDDENIIPTSLVASVDKDFLATTCVIEQEVEADNLEDNDLQEYLEGFLASSSWELG